MVQLVAGMKYDERFDVLEVGTNKEGHEIRLLWDRVLEQFGVQNFDEFYLYDDKQPAVDLFNKITKKELWIVVIVEPFYPSVYHFDKEDEAREAYERYESGGNAVHLAKVLDATAQIEEGDYKAQKDSVHTVLVKEENIVDRTVDIKKLNIDW